MQVTPALEARRGWALPAFFAVTMLLASGLLFLVQPMCAKMVLPLLGGTPGVWNTCMVFFQAGLLAGYAYAHAGPRWLGPRGHAVFHLGLLAVPLLFLPIALGQIPPNPEDPPALWLLHALLLSAGLPFFILATTAPLLQRWYAALGARDPYYLYAASNVGSMAALLGYPFLVEPNFSLSRQSFHWTAGYAIAAALIAGCVVVSYARGWHATPVQTYKSSELAPRLSDRLHWLVLALVPSSLMLSITTFLTTDIAAIPLFWVVPLALYLLTFILVFAGTPLLPHNVFLHWMPLLIIVLVVIRLTEATQPVGLLLGIHVFGLFWICMCCHGELARRRPAATYLTEYYLWLALGGVLGGMFNALVAPVIFTSVVEYPLMLVAACLLLPGRAGGVSPLISPPSARTTPVPVRGTLKNQGAHAPRSPFARDCLFPALLGLATLGLVLLGNRLRVEPGPLSVAVMFLLPIVICYTFVERPLRFGLGMAAVLLAAGFYPGVHGRTLYQARSFFGVYRVTEERGFRKLVHGNTVHGMQSLDPEEGEYPLTYYHRDGPIGKLLTALKGDPRLERVGLVGLGTGALAYYAQPGQHWTFFEIDPEVIRIAGPDAELFTYLRRCQATVDVIAADGRLGLAGSSDRFGVIIVDAFNSDAIPAHLLTREALQVYRSRLKPEGLLAFHISNRYLDLEPVLNSLAEHAKPRMTCLVWDDRAQIDRATGRMPAQWAVMVSAPKSLSPEGGWLPARRNSALRVWTDDFSNLFEVFKWRDGSD
jgi:spermidine synthase